MVRGRGTALALLGVVALPAGSADPIAIQRVGDIGLWVWLALIAIVAIALVVRLALADARRRRPEPPEAITHARPVVARNKQPIRMATPLGQTAPAMAGGGPAPGAADQPPPAGAAPRTMPDDLQVVEGIGPRIAGILREAGIDTLARLAAADADRLREILRAAGLRAPADPTTWPEQARLADADDRTALVALQDRLRGGRQDRG